MTEKETLQNISTEQLAPTPPPDPDTVAENAAFLAEMARRRAAQNPPPATETALPKQPLWKQKVSAHSGVAQTGIVGFLLRHGLAKNEQQANVILIGILVAAVVLTAWVLWPRGPASTNPPPGTAGTNTRTAPIP